MSFRKKNFFSDKIFQTESYPMQTKWISWKRKRNWWDNTFIILYCMHTKLLLCKQLFIIWTLLNYKFIFPLLFSVYLWVTVGKTLISAAKISLALNDFCILQERIRNKMIQTKQEIIDWLVGWRYYLFKYRFFKNPHSVPILRFSIFTLDYLQHINYG